MRSVIQRVSHAQVSVDGEVVGAITRPGIVAFVGISRDDSQQQVGIMVRKIAELRLLHNEESVTTAGAPVLLISQFTLYGDSSKGRRPSWSAAAPGDIAEPLIDSIGQGLRDRGIEVATGRFGAMMEVELVNDGPFTLIIDV